MPANPNWDALLSTTLKNYRSTLEDNVFTARPLIAFLSKKGQIRQIGGGATIVEQLMHATNTTAKSYTGYDTLDITPQEGISAAEYNWKQLAGTVAISGIEKAMNSGKEQQINLLEAKIMQTEESLSEKLNQMLYADGTGNSGKDWTGLQAIVDDTSTLGGINPATAGNEFWKSIVNSSAGVRDDSEWTTVYNTASRGGASMPDFAITTQDLLEHYEAGLAPQIRYTSTDEGDARFQHLMFKGVPVFWDVHCPAGVTYFLNSKNIKLVGHTDVWFKDTPFKQPVDKDATYSQILCYGNLTTNARIRLGKLTGQTLV